MYEKYVKLRDERGVSDYKVFKETGITKSTFSDWKSGRSKPKIDKLVILADYFGVPVTVFIERGGYEVEQSKSSLQSADGGIKGCGNINS
ncbi:MAG: helix-turn-helix transcriptional regulator [Lachnospiraceae bacterium]|nr:helix-turn-helix transcriptional regulator [Lachnospiraceae bacterium]